MVYGDGGRGNVVEMWDGGVVKCGVAFVGVKLENACREVWGYVVYRDVRCEGGS